jgi:hypothetical protein
MAEEPLISKVFVSSTFIDLKEERNQVLEAIKYLQYKEIAMEYWGANPKEPIESCLNKVRKSNIFIGIIAHLYGNIVEKTGKSFTQMEYEEALRLNLPCLIYFKNEDVEVLPSFVERNPDSIKKLDEFKRTLSKKHTIGFF